MLTGPAARPTDPIRGVQPRRWGDGDAAVRVKGRRKLEIKKVKRKEIPSRVVASTLTISVWPTRSQYAHTFVQFILVMWCLTSTRRSTLGDWSFPMSAAWVWNALPQPVRNAPSLPVFRQELKTVLFRSSFPDVIWQCTVLYLHAVAQCWSVIMYWLLQTDFVDTVQWSCSSSAIMPNE